LAIIPVFSAVLKRHWFIISIVLAIVVALLVPRVGVFLNPDGTTTTVAVLLAFLAIGFTLPSEKIAAGISNVKFHLYVELFIFAVVPAYVLLTVPLFGDLFRPEVRVGLYALAVLPTTVTSCVIFTGAACGNSVSAIFNAAFSNVTGVLLSPLLLSLILSGAGAGMSPAEAGHIIAGLGLQMLLPLLVGQVLRRALSGFAAKHGKKVSSASSVFIVVIVFFTFSRAASGAAFATNIARMPLPFAYLAVSHIILQIGARLGARLFGFPLEDRVAAMYVAPQKTLALGAPLLTIYFASQPELLAIAILPLAFYHPFQLLVASVGKGIKALTACERAPEY